MSIKLGLSDLLVIPFQTSETEYVLLIILRDMNIQRLKDYDPIDVRMKHMPLQVVKGLTLKSIGISYCTEAEAIQIMDQCATGQSIKSTLDLISRGWKFRPDLGDSDRDATCINPPGRG